MPDFRSKTSYSVVMGKGKEEAVTEDVSESCHGRPIRCLRSQIYLAWLEIWRRFILGARSIQPFCWDLLHSVVPHHQSWHLLAMKEQPCVSTYTLSLHFRPVLPLTLSYTLLSLAYVYPSFFRVHTALIAEIYLCLQSCLWSVAAEFPEKATVLFFQFFTRLYRKKTSSWWKKHCFGCREI